MTKEYQIRVLPVVAASENAIKRYLAEEQGIDQRTINSVRVLKKSIDARQRTIFVNLKIRVYINEVPNIRTWRTDRRLWWWVKVLADSSLRYDSLSSDCAPLCWSAERMCARERWISRR